MHETAKETYEFGKLKKFLTMVKLMMQDALFNLTFTSCYKFIDTLTSYVPASTVIESPSKVSNTFELTAEQLEIDPDYAKRNPPIPLFAIDILKGPGDKFVYSTDPKMFISRVVEVF